MSHSTGPIAFDMDPSDDEEDMEFPELYCPPCKSDNDDQVLVHDSVRTIPNINEPTIKHILFVREAIEEC